MTLSQRLISHRTLSAAKTLCCKTNSPTTILRHPPTKNSNTITHNLTIQIRTKKSSSSDNTRKSAISRTIEANKNSTSATEGASEEALFVDNIFGMRPVDYTVLPPIRGSPPPPPTKPGMRKYIFPATLVIALATFGYFYVNNKNDNFEYWSAMQRGEALQMDGDEDDDEEEEE